MMNENQIEIIKNIISTKEYPQRKERRCAAYMEWLTEIRKIRLNRVLIQTANLNNDQIELFIKEYEAGAKIKV
jgi:hypothetical protein